jgi:outer membrane protein insertion porin family
MAHLMHRPDRPHRLVLLATLLPTLLCAVGAAAFTDEEQPLLGEIVIEGNTRTSETLIRRELGLAVGQVFTFDDMDAVWDHLEDVGYFAFVDMEYDDSDPQAVVLRVVVEEDVTLHYGPLVRYDRRHKYQLGAKLKERNLGGRGQVLDAEVSFYYLQRGRLSWRDPWTFGVRGLELSATVDAEQAGFVYRPFRYRKWNGGLELRWQFTGPFYVLGGATYGSFRQRDDYVWPGPDRGEGPGPVTAYAGGTATHVVGRAALGVDTRDNPYYPSRGVLVEGNLRRWSSSDFADYLETGAEARVFVPMPFDKHVLAGRAWGRRTDGPAQIDNVLYLGGPQTVRGYRFGGREGDEGWLASVEYRLPLFIMPISPRGELIGAGLHAFADAGDAWYEGAAAGRPMQSWGAGVHLNLDTLQLRFEAARTREGDWVFEFMDTFNF